MHDIFPAPRQADTQANVEMKDRMSWDSAGGGMGHPPGLMLDFLSPPSSRSRSRSLEPGSREYSDLRAVSTPTRWHPQYAPPGNGTDEYSGAVADATGSSNSNSSVQAFSGKPRSNGSLSSNYFLSPIPEDSATLHHRLSDNSIRFPGGETSRHSEGEWRGEEDDEEEQGGGGKDGRHQFVTRWRHSENDLTLRATLSNAAGSGSGRFAKRGGGEIGKSRRLQSPGTASGGRDWEHRGPKARFYLGRGADHSASTSSEGYSSSPSNRRGIWTGVSGDGDGGVGMRQPVYQGGAGSSSRRRMRESSPDEYSSSDSESSDAVRNSSFLGRGGPNIDRRRSTSFLRSRANDENDSSTATNTNNGRLFPGDSLSSSSFSWSRTSDDNNSHHHNRQRRHSYHPAAFAANTTDTGAEGPSNALPRSKSARRSSHPDLQRRSSISPVPAGGGTGVRGGGGGGGGSSSSQPSSRRPSVQSDKSRRMTPNQEQQQQRSGSPTKAKPASSSNFLTVPGRSAGGGGGSGSDIAGGDVSAVTPSDGAVTGDRKTSLSGSRRQRIFDMSAGGGTTSAATGISAQMVSNDPARAANLAFSSLTLPADLIMAPASKHIRRVCSPIVTCFLLLMLAASMTAAVYFAVVLNKTQAEHIEYLKATLNFHLNQASAEKLTTMTASELSAFEEQYCQEISEYYRKSELANDYKGCDVASVQDGQLRLMLYFNSSPSNQSLTDEQRKRDVILDVLASSAPRVGQDQDDVISINNIEVKLDTVDITLTKATEIPRFGLVEDNGQNADTDNDTDSGAFVSTKPKKEFTTPLRPTRPFTSPDEEPDPLHPCQPGQSGTYYRYPGSCSIFFQCLEGESITMGCGAQLVFDMDARTCVPEVNDCDSPAREAEMYGGDVSPEDLQPCEHKGGNLHPHPMACNLYFQCTASGSSVIRVCPHGLIFSERLQTCDLLKAAVGQCPGAGSAGRVPGDSGGSAPATRGMNLELHALESIKEQEEDEAGHDAVAGTKIGAKTGEHEKENGGNGGVVGRDVEEAGGGAEDSARGSNPGLNPEAGTAGDDDSGELTALGPAVAGVVDGVRLDENMGNGADNRGEDVDSGEEGGDVTSTPSTRGLNPGHQGNGTDTRGEGADSGETGGAVTVKPTTRGLNPGHQGNGTDTRGEGADSGETGGAVTVKPTTRGLNPGHQGNGTDARGEGADSGEAGRAVTAKPTSRGLNPRQQHAAENFKDENKIEATEARPVVSAVPDSAKLDVNEKRSKLTSGTEIPPDRSTKAPNKDRKRETPDDDSNRNQSTNILSDKQT